MENVLHLSPSSWVGLSSLPSDILAEYESNWSAVWNLRNTVEESKVITGGITRESPRIHASYGAVPSYRGSEPSYMFSGSAGGCAKGKHADIPQLFMPLVNHFNKDVDGAYNEVTVNWYEDGRNYTAQHADYTEGMNLDLPIVIVTFCPDSEKLLRQFWIRAKSSAAALGDGTAEGASDGRFARCSAKSETAPITGGDLYIDSLLIPTHHGRVIRMGGRMQEEYRHGVPKHSIDPQSCAPRVSVTLRAYKVGSV
jgi:alkylated DNA repair dioxygenase AlkB